MYLIFDASGAGKAKSFKAPVENIHSWPRLIHLSWIVLNEELKPIEDFDCVIKPVGFSFTEEMAKKNHIEFELAKESGHDVKEVLNQFKETVINAKFVFAHNLNFNEKVVGAAYIRHNIKHKLHYANSHCLMHEGTYYCKLKGKGPGYKWPTLQELHCKIFNQQYSPANNARADVIAASRCFIGLHKAGAFDDILEDL